MKVGILTTHPIQYQVPWFRALAAVSGIDLTVFFCLIPNATQQGDGFGIRLQWDVPLLNGYTHRVLPNVSKSPSITTFFGCDTPDIDRVVREEDFDAFIVNGWGAKSCLQLLFACRRYGVPCIVRGESNDLRLRAAWKRVLHRCLTSFYDAFLYIGESNRRFYLANGVKPSKLFAAPYCVDNAGFSKAAMAVQSQRNEARDEWGIPRDAVVFLFCGKFVHKKRPMDCIEALRSAISAAGKLHLLMVGTGELLAECQAVVQRDSLPVTFAGFLNQSEMPRAYAVSDCLVLPSDEGETWGLVVNEAMACGLPALVSDRVGCREDLVEPGVTGDVFAVGDTAKLSLLLRSFAADPLSRATMGAEARERVGCYSYEAVVRGTIQALSFVCATGVRKRVQSDG